MTIVVSVNYFSVWGERRGVGAFNVFVFLVFFCFLFFVFGFEPRSQRVSSVFDLIYIKRTENLTRVHIVLTELA